MYIVDMKYSRDPDIQNQIIEISDRLGMVHDISRIICIRSTGSKSKRTLARCHSMSKAVQTALGLKAHYVIEVVSENFDRLPEEERTKTLIHELMHIPKSFGGGFKGHRVVNRISVEQMYKIYKDSFQGFGNTLILQS
ncbi:MAG: putative metallopeptidase [Candidatus Aenigmatarchaeota archaeon]